jgi:hypothetical protein
MAVRKTLKLILPDPKGGSSRTTRAPLDDKTVVMLRIAARHVRSRADESKSKHVYVALLQGVPGHTPFSLYVGRTGLTPQKRYLQHRAGVQSGKGWIKKYGIGLLPQLVARLNPMSDHSARFVIEAELAQALRESGLTVVQS